MTNDGSVSGGNAAGGSGRSYVDELARLADLRDRGALSDDEFEDEKRRLRETRAAPQPPLPPPSPSLAKPATPFVPPPTVRPAKSGTSLPMVVALFAALIGLAIIAVYGFGNRTATETVATVGEDDAPKRDAADRQESARQESDRQETADTETATASDPVDLFPRDEAVGRDATGTVSMPDEPAPEYAPRASAPMTGDGIRISAVELGNAFLANRAGAERALANRPLEVIGRIRSIETNSAGTSVIRMTGGNRFIDVSALLDGGNTGRVNLTLGNSVRLRCSNVRVIVGPQLSGCDIL